MTMTNAADRLTGLQLADTKTGDKRSAAAMQQTESEEPAEESDMAHESKRQKASADQSEGPPGAPNTTQNP